MIKTIKRLLMSVSLLTVLMAPALMPATAAAAESEIGNGISCGVELDATKITSDNKGCKSDQGDPSQKVDDIVKLVINIFSWIVGIIAVIMIIIGGLKYITSGGESGNVTGAKNTILYAVVGLVVVALAQFLVRFVLDKVGN